MIQSFLNENEPETMKGNISGIQGGPLAPSHESQLERLEGAILAGRRMLIANSRRIWPRNGLDKGPRDLFHRTEQD